jgi:hypothetical protein
MGGAGGGVLSGHAPNRGEEIIHRTAARMSDRCLPSAAQLEQASEAADAIAARVRLRVGEGVPGLWGGAATGAKAGEYIAGEDAIALGREAMELLSGLSGQVSCL